MTPPARTNSVQYESAGFRMIVAPECQERLRAEGWTHTQGFDEKMAQARRVAGGRGPNWIVEMLGTEQRIRIRPIRHGGVLGSWLGDRSWSATRVVREFLLWRTLIDQKVSLPVPVFAISRRGGIFWRSAFASIERESARDGAEWLAEDPSPVQLAAMCVSFAKSIRRFHDAGAIHGDLQIRNVLIEPDRNRDRARGDDLDAQRCLLIDLDRTRIVDRVSPRQRIRELLRLLRSLEKTGHTRLTSKRYRALALSAYCAGDRTLRRSMMRWSRLERLGIVRHRMAWKFGRLGV